MVAHVLERLPVRALLDGAIGTELIARGFRPQVECPEAWNLARPDVLEAIHAAYVTAGCDAVQTNTFGGSRPRLTLFGRAGDVRALNIAGARLARQACPAGKLVIGSMGPTGLIPPPEGDADLFALEDAFAEQASALAEGGADLVHLETMYHPKEVRAALRGVHAGAPGLAVVASMTCQLTAGGYVTPLGFAAERMLAACLEEQADGVGINCTLGPAEMLDLVRFLRERTDRPLFAKPTRSPTSGVPASAEDLACGALALFAAGATAVGGCCGAGPADLAIVRRAIDATPLSPDELLRSGRIVRPR